MNVSTYLRPAAVLTMAVLIVAGVSAAQARHGAVVRRAGIHFLAMVGPTAGWALETTTILTTKTDGSVWLNVTPPGVDVTPSSMVFALNARHGLGDGNPHRVTVTHIAAYHRYGAYLASEPAADPDRRRGDWATYLHRSATW